MPNVTITPPTVGSDIGTWGPELNTALLALQGAINALPQTALVFYTGTSWPAFPTYPVIAVSSNYPSAPQPAAADGSVWIGTT